MTVGKTLRAMPLLAVLAGSISPAIAAIKVKPVNLQCTMIGMGDVILMRARFQSFKGMPRTFNAVFQGKHAYGAGRRMTVVAAGTDVGTIKLKPVLGGDVGGELFLNHAPAFGDHSKPFPPDFPQLAPDSTIAVKSGDKTVLSCSLENQQTGG